MKPIRLAQHHHHIDNGGVSFFVDDCGVDEGIILTMQTQYHGHPAIQSTLCLDNLGANWCSEIALMFEETAAKMSEIDWETRY